MSGAPPGNETQGLAGVSGPGRGMVVKNRGRGHYLPMFVDVLCSL